MPTSYFDSAMECYISGRNGGKITFDGNFMNFSEHIASIEDNSKFNPYSIRDVIFNDPATIVIWQDGTKTVVKCQKDKGDTYNPEHGLAMCIIKKMCGNKSNFNNIFTKWLPKE